MQVQASAYSVLTHKSFPSLESGSTTFFFLWKKMGSASCLEI